MSVIPLGNPLQSEEQVMGMAFVITRATDFPRVGANRGPWFGARLV